MRMVPDHQRDGPIEVVVREVPTATYLAARRHIDRLLGHHAGRGPSGGDGSPETEVVVAAAAILADDRRAHSTAQVEAAFVRGDPTVDITYRVDDPSEIRLVIRGLPLLQAADRYARLGSLPAPPADPDVRSFWRWFADALEHALADAGVEGSGP